MSIRLLDSFTGNSFTATHESAIYSFNVTSDPASFGSSRFKLLFGEEGPTLTARNGTTCNSGVVTLGASGATEGSYKWYESAAGGVAITGATSSTYTTPILTSTKTYYVTTANTVGCEGLRIPVIATINITTSTITAKDGSTVTRVQ